MLYINSKDIETIPSCRLARYHETLSIGNRNFGGVYYKRDKCKVDKFHLQVSFTILVISSYKV
jgi:hypothetical protein